MSEDSKDNATPPASTNTGTSTSNKPDADVTSRVEQAAAQAAKDAMKDAASQVTDQVLEGIIDKLSPKKDPIDPLLKEFAKNPELVLKANRELTVEQIKGALASDAAKKKADEQALQPILEEYPELRGKLDYAEFEMEKSYQENPDLPRAEHIKKGAEKAAQNLGLKKLTEEEKAKRKQDAFIPPTGGGHGGDSPERDRKQAAQNFIKMRTAAALSTRVKTLPKAAA